MNLLDLCFRLSWLQVYNQLLFTDLLRKSGARAVSCSHENKTVKKIMVSKVLKIRFHLESWLISGGNSEILSSEIQSEYMAKQSANAQLTTTLKRMDNRLQLKLPWEYIRDTLAHKKTWNHGICQRALKSQTYCNFL